MMKKIFKLMVVAMCAFVVIAIIKCNKETNVLSNEFADEVNCSDLYQNITAVKELPKDAVFETNSSNAKLADGKFSRYYTALNAEQKHLYDQIDAGIKTYPTNAANIYGVNFSRMSEQELFDTIWSWFYSNPDIYWITSACNYSYNSHGDITGVYFVSYDCDVETFLNKVESVKEAALQYDTNYDRLHEIQRLVCENNIYDYDFDNNLTFNQTTYSAIVGGKTVCAGYGRAMNYIANLCDIDVESVVTPEHLFNYYIEGDYAYLMDLTWDDAEPVRYNYFLIGSETLNKIDNSTHHTALEYNVFPTLALSDYAKPYEEPETTEPKEIIEVETTTPEETTPYIEPTTPYAEPTLPYIEPTTPYIEPTTQEEIIPEPTTIYEEQTTPYIDTEASFVAHRTQAEADEMLDRNPITLIPYKGNNYVGESYVIFVLQYLESREENTEVKEIYFSQDENIAFWECGLFLKAGEKNGTTIVGVKACIDGVMRTDHIMVTVNNGKFVSIMFEKH